MNIINMKVSIRNARKNGVISFAKIFGLSISFAVILFAVCYVFYETSFDKSVTDANRIYRCLMQGNFNNEAIDYAVTSAAQGPSMVAEVPEITESLRMFNQGKADITSNKNDFLKGNLFYSDANCLSFWDIPVKSNINGLFTDNNSLAVSESIAKKLFGTAENALGKSVTFRSNSCVITAVFEDIPKNFHLQFDFLQPIEREIKGSLRWGNQSYYTYIKTVSPNMNIDDLTFKISKNVYTHYNNGVDGAKAQTLDNLRYDKNNYLYFTAEPLSAIHFSKHKFDSAITANKTYVYGAIILALLVLLISSVNFINLSIANLSTRFKEVGIRKTIGAFKVHILSQLINETVLFFIISLAIAIGIFFAFGNSLSQHLGFDINLTTINLFKIIAISSVFLLLFLLSINIIPIWMTSRNETLNLIKGKSNKRKQQWGSNTFVLIQFMLSVVIILSSVIMTKQINYMVTKNKGYTSDNIMSINLWRLGEQQRESFMKQLETYPAIQSVSSSMRTIGYDIGMEGAYFEDRNDESNYFHPSVLPVDGNFSKTFDLTMKEGRFFNTALETDKNVAIINEAAAAEYKKAGSLIGKKLIADGDFEIIGIVKDFNFRSLHHAVEPLVITYSKNQGNVYLEMSMDNSAEVIAIVQNLWNEFNINQQFDYTFLDDILARNYAKDQQAKKLLMLLSLISIIIACVGLYAVSFFTIIRKTKEIGVRKVNGATISEIMKMLNMDFVKWVLLSFIIATPIAWYAMHKWLENFAYKTTLSWWIFALAGLLALGIALLTVSWQSWRAATRNPVEALRYE
nr:FtsX-like permease family protein [uncultured Draconibacterium sp.]